MMLMILQKCVIKILGVHIFVLLVGRIPVGDKINLEFHKDNKLRHTEPIRTMPRRCI